MNELLRDKYQFGGEIMEGVTKQIPTVKEQLKKDPVVLKNVEVQGSINLDDKRKQSQTAQGSGALRLLKDEAGDVLMIEVPCSCGQTKRISLQY